MVSKNADFPPTEQYCKSCWSQWWNDKDRVERSDAMSKEKDALRVRAKTDLASWNAIAINIRPVVTFQYVFHIEKTANASESLRKRVLMSYLRLVLEPAVLDELWPSLILSGATVFCNRDFRSQLLAPLRRPVRAGGFQTEVELLPGECQEITLDPMKGSELALQYFNCLLQQALKLTGLQRSGTMYCDESRSRVYNDMVILPAYFSTIQMMNKKLYLLVQPRTRVQPTATALEWIKRAGFRDRDLIGQEVISTYGTKKRSYKIYRIDPETTPRSTFTLQTGATISFVEYYQTQYGLTVTALDQPMLWADKAGKVKLIPEFMIVDLMSTEGRRTLPTRCSRMPELMHKECVAFGARLQIPAVKAFFEANSVAIPDSKLENVKVREMKPVQVTLAGGMSVRPNQDFGPMTMKLKLAAPRRDVTLIAWGDESLNFAIEINRLNEQIQGVWRMTNAAPVHVPGNEDEETFVERCLKSLPKPSTKFPNVLVICTLKNGHSKRGEHIYGVLKFALCKAGIQSHFVDWSKFGSNRSQDAYGHNIMKNISSKMGEPLWNVNLVAHVPELAGGTVFIGYDVYHDKRTESTATGALEYQRRSLAGFVAWYNRPDGKWFHLCETDLHTSKQEVMNAADDTMSEKSGKDSASSHGDHTSLGAFISQVFAILVKTNKCARVVVYRDGVGDSMLGQVKEEEMPMIRDAMPQSVNLCFMVVQKRVHDRYLAPTTKSTAPLVEEWHNLPRGHTIDYGPTAFMQIAVDCTLSSSKPVRYIVLANGKLSMDSIQQMTFALCWTYYNWPGSVKVPFVLQCAHKLAYFHGTASIDKPDVHPLLKEQPYYL
jgi:aubergine-like protein